MEIKIYEEKKKKEPVLRLALKEVPYRGVVLLAVDENGNSINSNYILQITEKGLYLNPNVNEDLGIPLDSHGKIKLTN